MKSYNGFSPSERMAGDKIIKEAINNGVLTKLSMTSCSLCGQNRGIRHYHCEDYSKDRILDDVKPLCWRCHMMLHNRFKHPKSWEKYLEQVEKGARFSPVFRGNAWEELEQHFID